MNEKRYEERCNQDRKEILRLKDNLDKHNKLREDGEIITLAAYMFIISGKENLALLGGAYKKYMDFWPAYSVFYHMFNYNVENKLDVLNFMV